MIDGVSLCEHERRYIQIRKEFKQTCGYAKVNESKIYWLVLLRFANECHVTSQGRVPNFKEFGFKVSPSFIAYKVEIP